MPGQENTWVPKLECICLCFKSSEALRHFSSLHLRLLSLGIFNKKTLNSFFLKYCFSTFIFSLGTRCNFFLLLSSSSISLLQSCV